MLKTIADFLNDKQGKTFSDVTNDTRINFQKVIAFFVHPDRIRRLIESEIDHDRPPLAGLIIEFEMQPYVDNFLRLEDGHNTTRFRQAVGVLIRIIMVNNLGWSKTGKKGSLGKRAQVPPRTTTPGAYHNVKGLAIWFTRAERYEPPEDWSMDKIRQNLGSNLGRTQKSD